MKEITNDDRLIRRFLLGELDEGERERVETLFLSEPDFRERVLIAEDELVENFLEDSLGEGERKKFIANFLTAPQQRRKLRLTASLRKIAAAEPVGYLLAAKEVPRPSPQEYWNWNTLIRRKRIVLIPLAAALIIAVAFSAKWFLQYQRSDPIDAVERRRHSAIAEALVALNAPSNQDPDQAPGLSVVLPPVSVRAPGTGTTLSASAERADLWLVVGTGYPRYQATIQRVGAKDRFTINDLSIETGPEGKAVRLRIPVRLLGRGLYQVALSGASTDGKVDGVGEYQFGVDN